ncbi:FecR family protein [Butyricimonas sp. Marseille-P3923]|uniref:FecR family protein n=1 Tax=Butyricimonas sp. Marseille-P3923 TaxID=1987504 RepID=UPI000C075AE1|nr:FecR domain-containing protein [Butyricimonas sp. Marseille-P3923]
MDKNFEIADIIVAFIKNEATPRQISVLDDWINESEANKRLFISLLDEVAFEQRLDRSRVLELEDAFGKVRARVRKSKRGYWRYVAVAASVAVVVAIGGIMAYWVGIPEKQGIVTRQQSISVGKSRAFLTLGTGEKVALESQDTLLRGKAMNIRIQENGEVFYEMADSIAPAEVEYNIMETPRGAEFQLVLSDGTKVWLNAGTKLRYPVKFIGKERRVELTGEAYFDVTRDEDVPFVVETSRSAVTVLGTEFCVRDYAGEANLTTLVQGSVSVEDQRGNAYLIRPGQQVNIGKEDSRVLDVETIYFTSWKDGYFIFNEATLSEIMSELSKWYDFDCFFLNPDAGNERLTARLKKYDDISVILDILSRTGNIQFTQKGRAITVRSAC